MICVSLSELNIEIDLAQKLTITLFAFTYLHDLANGLCIVLQEVPVEFQADQFVDILSRIVEERRCSNNNSNSSSNSSSHKGLVNCFSIFYVCTDLFDTSHMQKVSVC